MSDTLLHCFACDAFTPQNGDELVCSQCSSDFVEIVQVERSPGQGTPMSSSTRGRNEDAHGNVAPGGQAERVPGIQGMLTSLLSSILPQATAEERQDRPSHDTESPVDTEAERERRQERLAQDYVDDAQRPPFNDFFSQIFGQFPPDQASSTTANSSNFYRTRSAPDGSTFTFSFGSSAGRDRLPFTTFLANMANDPNSHSAQARSEHGSEARAAFPQRMPDLASFLTQALGIAPGTAVGDYANGEAFDNIISELMSRNPQSNVRPASEIAVSQLKRIVLQQDQPGKAGELIGEECSICQDEYAEKEVLVELSCHHIYHEECLLSWVKTNGVCPICRTPVTENTPTNIALEQEELD